MKRWQWMVIVAVLAVLLAGCGDGNRRPSSPDDVQRIRLQESRALLDDGRAVLYDVRSAAAYRTQHAAGAISFPEEEVDARLEELPEDKALVFYCT